MKDGSDIMDKADILIAQRREESEFKLQSLKAEAMQQRLLVVLEEEQERNGREKRFGGAKQPRSVEEQKQLAAIFDQEREAASARIMMLTQSLAHRGKSGTKLLFEGEEQNDHDGNGSDNESNELDSDNEDVVTRLQNIEEELVDEGSQLGPSESHGMTMSQGEGIGEDQAAMSMFDLPLHLVDGVLDGDSNHQQLSIEYGTSHISLPSIRKGEESAGVGIDLDAMFYESESGGLPDINRSSREGKEQQHPKKNESKNTQNPEARNKESNEKVVETIRRGR